MTIEFRQLGEDNYEECLGIGVRADQPFVASNAKSLVQAGFHDDAIPRAIYVDGVMVGFLMYIIDAGSGELYLWRFMIDQRHQGKGYGHAALSLLERIAKAHPGIVRIKLGTSPTHPATIVASQPVHLLGYGRVNARVSASPQSEIKLPGE